MRVVQEDHEPVAPSGQGGQQPPERGRAVVAARGWRTEFVGDAGGEVRSVVLPARHRNGHRGRALVGEPLTCSCEDRAAADPCGAGEHDERDVRAVQADVDDSVDDLAVDG
nr:hypothetical protein [Saccharopolyspora gregorii]